MKIYLPFSRSYGRPELCPTTYHCFRFLETQRSWYSRRDLCFARQDLGGCWSRRRGKETQIYTTLAYVLSHIHFSQLDTIHTASAEASNGTGFIHKSKLNTNGSFSVGKTWKLIELRAVQVVNVRISSKQSYDDRRRRYSQLFSLWVSTSLYRGHIDGKLRILLSRRLLLRHSCNYLGS